MVMMKRIVCISPLIVGLCFLPSCVGRAKKKVAASREQALQVWKNELKAQETGVQKKHYAANWTKAKKDLLWMSPNIIRAEFQIDDSIEARMDIWKTFIPSLSASFTESSTLGDIGDLFTDTSLRVSSFFSFGSLLDLPKRYATLTVTHMGVEWSSEIAMRNEVIALYRTFREKQLLDFELKELKKQRAFIKEASIDDEAPAFLKELKEADKSIKEHVKKIEGWKEKFSDLHQINYADVKLTFNDLPDISYTPSQLNFYDSARWGVLQMNLLALEELSSNESLRSAYTRYYPTPNLSVTAPSLYSNIEGQEFELEDVRIGPSLGWRLDTRGTIGKQIRRIKRDRPFGDWTKDKRRTEEVKALLDGKKALGEVQKEIQKKRTLMKEYRAVVNQGLVDDLEAALRQMKAYQREEISLLAREIEINTSFWLLDEYKWAETTKQWKRIRLEREKLKPRAWYKGLFSKKQNRPFNRAPSE